MTVREKLPANDLKEREVLMSLMYWKNMDNDDQSMENPIKSCMTMEGSSLYLKYSSIFYSKT